MLIAETREEELPGLVHHHHGANRNKNAAENKTIQQLFQHLKNEIKMKTYCPSRTILSVVAVSLMCPAASLKMALIKIVSFLSFVGAPCTMSR